MMSYNEALGKADEALREMDEIDLNLDEPTCRGHVSRIIAACILKGQAALLSEQISSRVQ
jgi:hypothetical protein